MRLLLISIACFLNSGGVFAQGCCSGGSGSPVAGGTSQGVLSYRQFEIASNFQYLNTNKFMTGDKEAMDFLDNFNTKYIYSRLAYGVSERLTMSVESGYYINKTQIALNKKDKEESRGIGDLILFPRFKVYEHNTEKTRDEIAIGLGYKIPIGRYYDSTVVYTDMTGKDFYTPKPPVVLPTTGANDFIFYGFAFRGYPEKKFRIFANSIYIRKGWNALGQKFGDYASIGIFAGKSIRKHWGVTMQLKGVWIDEFDYDKKIDMLAVYNIDVNSFGSKKIAAVPQVNYSYKSFSVYALGEFPLYQYVSGTAIASQYLFTLGLSYRFFTFKQEG